MKPLSYVHPLIVFLILFLLVSCSQEEKITIDTHLTVEQARSWFESNNILQSESLGNEKESKVSKPDWGKARLVRIKESDVIIVPLGFADAKRFIKGTFSKLIISKDEKGNISMHTVKAIGNDGYMNTAGYRIGQSDFSGIVEIRDAAGKLTAGEYYLHGKPKALVEDAVADKPIVNTAARTASYKYILVETEWWQQVYIDGVSQGSTYLDSFYTYKLFWIDDSSSYNNLYGTYYDWTGGGGSGGSGGGGSGCSSSYCPDPGLPDQGDIGQITVDVVVVKRCVENQLTTPCLSGVADHVLDPNLVSTYNNLIQNVFNSSDKVNLILTEGSVTGNNVGATGTAITTSGITNVNITLDPTKLTSGSQEYIAAAIYHECFHALVNALTNNNVPTDDQHVAQFTNYLSLLAEGLHAAYPSSMQPGDAKGLLLTGLLALDEQYYAPGTPNKWPTAFVDKLLSFSSFSRTQIFTIQSRYQIQKTSGTICN